jgi:Fe-S oxidoreductase
MPIQGATLCREQALYECIQCGKCTGGCPVSIRSLLNPRKLVYEALLNVKFVPVEQMEIWECTTCGTCAERCPKKIRPVDLVLALRSNVIEGGRVKPSVRDALESTFMHGNPWGRTKEKRAEWVGDSDVKILTPGDKTDLIYYVCCTTSYDPNVQTLAKSLIQLFQKAGVDFGILGNEETCCANEMNELGEKGLFEIAQDKNQKIWSQYAFSRMVTTSPHCFHAFSNEYPDHDFEVLHYTQFISRLIQNDRVKFQGKLAKKVTYHDPCFLGKQNKIFEEPRHILQSIPGVEYLEMDRSRERSLCCEGGGGRMWMESESTEERLAEIRVKDAVVMGADILATACPFCLLTLQDAVKTSGNEGKIEIKDIAELLSEVL